MKPAELDAMLAEASYVTESERIINELEALTAGEIRLHMGELSAQEMRAVRAFIGWRVHVIREFRAKAATTLLEDTKGTGDV